MAYHEKPGLLTALQFKENHVQYKGKLTPANARILRARQIRWSMPYYLLLLLPLTYLLVFKYLPMWGLQIGFREFRSNLPMLQMEWVGFKYFQKFLDSPSFWKIFTNTLILSFYSLLAGFPIPILLAVCLNESRSRRLKKTVQMVTFMPYFISTVVLVSMIIQFSDLQTGIINIWLRHLGGKPRGFMGLPDAFRSIYVWTGVWQTMGYNAVVYLAALSGVSQDLYDAARVDGANKWRKILHIDIPSIAPTIIILFILNTGSLLNIGFEKIFLMQNSMNLKYSEVISTYIYKMGIASTNYSFSTAVGFFNSLINFLLIVLANSVAKKFSETSLW